MLGARRARSGFTLIEVLIVTMVMAILGSMIMPKFGTSTDDAKVAALKHNLRMMRSQIQIYKVHHGGKAPTIFLGNLPQLTLPTNATGTTGPEGTSYPFGPYIRAVPVNPIDGKKTVVATAVFPPTAATAAGGWLYHAATGNITANLTDHLND